MKKTAMATPITTNAPLSPAMKPITPPDRDDE